MDKTTFNYIATAFLLILAQVIVFNHICLFGVAVPFVFIYLIVKLPLTMPVYNVLTIAFLLGLIIDMFSDTPGMNSLACTVVAMSRKGILRLYFNREDDLIDPSPSVKSLGVAVYVKYLLSVTLVYSAIIFIIEGFMFFHPWRMLLKIVCSTLLTSAIISGISAISVRSREKRL